MSVFLDTFCRKSPMKCQYEDYRKTLFPSGKLYMSQFHPLDSIGFYELAWRLHTVGYAN